MPYKMSEFQSIDPGHVSKLREVGIDTTDDMLRLWKASDRVSLVEQVGVSNDDFSRWVGLARLARVKSMGVKHVELLVAAGVDGPRRLGEYTPEKLVAHLTQVIGEKKLSGVAPTLDEVATWQADLKPVGADTK